MAPIAIAAMMEHIGDMSAISATVGSNFMEDPGLHRPTEKVRPPEKPRPQTRMTAAMMRFRELVKSTWFSTMLRTPMAEIMP